MAFSKKMGIWGLMNILWKTVVLIGITFFWTSSSFSAEFSHKEFLSSDCVNIL